jgi:hypothetical protein
MRSLVRALEPWADRFTQVVAEQAAQQPVETPRQQLAREYADFLLRAPVREVVEHFLEAAQVWEHSSPRVRLSCGHTQFHTDRPRIRCASCWRELGPPGQRELFSREEDEHEQRERSDP